MFFPKKLKLGNYYNKASLIYKNYEATTDNTSISIRLNSSKQVQLPVDAIPINNFSIILTLI